MLHGRCIQMLLGYQRECLDVVLHIQMLVHSLCRDDIISVSILEERFLPRVFFSSTGSIALAASVGGVFVVRVLALLQEILWAFLPQVARIEVFNPPLKRTGDAADPLSHAGFAGIALITVGACRLRMSLGKGEVCLQSALLLMAQG